MCSSDLSRASSSCQSSSGKWEQGLHNYSSAQAIRDHPGPQAAARAHQASGNRVYTIMLQLSRSEIIQGLKQLPELIRQVRTGFVQLNPSSGNLGAHQASGNRVYTIMLQLRQSGIIKCLKQLPARSVSQSGSADPIQSESNPDPKNCFWDRF